MSETLREIERQDGDEDETDLTSEDLRARWKEGEPVEIVDGLEERVTALEKTVAWLLRTQDSHPAGSSIH